MLNRRAIIGAAGAALALGTPAAARTRLRRGAVSFAGRRVNYLARLAPHAPGELRPMLLCLGGGDANPGIAEYFDAVYTPESVYRDHHVILPIGPAGSYFHQFSDREIAGMLAALSAAEPVGGRGIVSGVSNGGRAAFRFAQAAPDSFRAIITIPGEMLDRSVPPEWRDYAVLLAHGGADHGWRGRTREAYETLAGKVGGLAMLELAGQGHVVGPTYNIDPLYARLRDMERRLGR